MTRIHSMKRLKQLACALTVMTLPGTTLWAETWPQPIQAIEARGAKIVGTFDAPDGLKGYAALYQGQGVALYLTPDGKHVLVGNLLDAKGEDLTQAPLQALVYEPMSKEMWSRMQGSTWITDGRADAPRILYVFSDPNCPYCTMFWQQARPWVEAGKVRLRHIMVGIIRADSANKSAALLSAKDPSAALSEHERAGKASTLKPMPSIPAALSKQLADNLALMGDLGAHATPAIFYLDDDQRLQQQQGAPRADVLEKIMGPRPK